MNLALFAFWSVCGYACLAVPFWRRINGRQLTTADHFFFFLGLCNVVVLAAYVAARLS